MLILNTSRTHNTHWQHKYKNTVIKEEGNKIHLGITKLNVQNHNLILFHTLKNDPKLFQILEKLFLINSFSYFQIRSVKPPLYRPTKWSTFCFKTFSKTAKVKQPIVLKFQPIVLKFQPVEISTAFYKTHLFKRLNIEMNLDQLKE